MIVAILNDRTIIASADLVSECSAALLPLGVKPFAPGQSVRFRVASPALQAAIEGGAALDSIDWILKDDMADLRPAVMPALAGAQPKPSTVNTREGRAEYIRCYGVGAALALAEALLSMAEYFLKSSQASDEVQEAAGRIRKALNLLQPEHCIEDPHIPGLPR